MQLAHGCLLSHLTLRFRQVVHDRGFKGGAVLPFVDGVDVVCSWELFSLVVGDVPSVSDKLDGRVVLFIRGVGEVVEVVECGVVVMLVGGLSP